MSAPQDVQIAAAAPAAPAPGGQAPFSVVCVQEAAALEPYLAAWDDLTAAAIEPNVFYESWMLLPALRAYGSGTTVVLVFSNLAPHRHGQPLLCGLFPLVRRRRLGARVLSLWSYIHCFLATPLVRAGFGPGALRALFDWLAHDRRGAALLECGRVTGDGPFYHLLLDYLREQRRGLWLLGAYARAFLCRGSGPLDRHVSGDKRRKLRRAEERLAEHGPVTYSELGPDGDLDAWLEDFLRLEASGWKRDTGSALVCRDADRDFFREVTRAAFGRRRLMMLSLNVGGRPVAQLCNFLVADGSFAFKVAFNEELARHSPGALLELENLRRLEAQPKIRWMDSCTDTTDVLIKQLWADRRIIQDILVETGRAPGPLVLGVLPLLRWCKRRLLGLLRRQPAPGNP